MGMACTTYAAPPRYETLALDAARSHATFTVKVLWLIPLHGEFGQVQGALHLDHFHGSARVEARLDAADLRMRSKHHEEWARSEEFFDAAQFPQIHFSSESFPLARLRSGGRIEGTLTLRGIVKPVRFAILPADCANPLLGACAVEAEGSIERSDFGMRSHRVTLADKVALHLSIVVHAAAAQP